LNKQKGQRKISFGPYLKPSIYIQTKLDCQGFFIEYLRADPLAHRTGKA
jgi:hypothetical protein